MLEENCFPSWMAQMLVTCQSLSITQSLDSPSTGKKEIVGILQKYGNLGGRLVEEAALSVDSFLEFVFNFPISSFHSFPVQLRNVPVLG